MTQSQILGLIDKLHHHGRCGGFMDVTDHPLKKTLFLKPLSSLRDRKLLRRKSLEPMLDLLSADNLHQTVSKLSSFKTRYYNSPSGVSAAHWIRDQFKTIGRNRTDVEVELFQHSFKQPSVIARIKGNGARAKEKVILGAHLDSIKVNFIGMPEPNGTAPGADDDASGVATIMEAFRVMVESGYRPERTIEFIGYAAEEVGLRGSQDIAQRYQGENQNVIGVIQFDMTFFPNPSHTMTLMTDYTNADLTEFTRNLIDTYVKVPVKLSKCGYGCSDHASWNEAGYATTIPTEAPLSEMNPLIHTSEDTLANDLDASFGLHYSKLALAFAMELSAEK